jgi:mevalonate kinase
MRAVSTLTIAHAPGKIILVGEHAVVYGRPAIAVPISEVRAEASVEDANRGQGTIIVAEDLGQTILVQEQMKDSPHPLAVAVTTTLDHLNLRRDQDLTITVRSQIPMASGLGSGAAVSAALARAVAQHFSRELSAEEISLLVYQVERIYHGTPSGIDNTVIAYERPVYFVRNRRPETFPLGRAMDLLIADSGQPSSTKQVVAAVRQARRQSRARYESLFDQVGEIAAGVRGALEEGDLARVGRMMDENHALLQALEVSSSRLDSLVQAARDHGASGAKLSGAGRGGNVIALVTQETRDEVGRALLSAGAERLISTRIPASAEPKPFSKLPAAQIWPDDGAI